MHKYLKGEWGQILFSDAQQLGKRHERAQTETQDVVSHYEKALFYFEGDRAVE